MPKVSSTEDVTALVQHLEALEAQRSTPCAPVNLMLVATETAAGALNLPTTARAPRVSAVTWGAEDLSAVLGATSTRDKDGRYWPVFAHCRLVTLLSASAAGRLPIDGVYTQIRDGEGLAAECAEAAAVGFRGRCLSTQIKSPSSMPPLPQAKPVSPPPRACSKPSELRKGGQDGFRL